MVVSLSYLPLVVDVGEIIQAGAHFIVRRRAGFGPGFACGRRLIRIVAVREQWWETTGVYDTNAVH